MSGVETTWQDNVPVDRVVTELYLARHSP